MRATSDVRVYLKRLLRAGLAYQAGDILSKGIALFMLPLYTAYVSRAGYGYAETLLTAVILLSIVLGFIYYNTIFLAKILGSSGKIPPVLAGWSQDVLFGLFAVFLILREE